MAGQKTRKLLSLAPVLAIAGALVAVSAGPADSAQRIKVGDNYFVRPSGVPKVTVSKGTKVKWVWTGDSVHNVKVVKGPVRFGSNSKRSGSFSKRMRKRGTYTIICTIHGGGDQKMKLVVR
jgi:plastocyanin